MRVVGQTFSLVPVRVLLFDLRSLNLRCICRVFTPSTSRHRVNTCLTVRYIALQHHFATRLVLLLVPGLSFTNSAFCYNRRLHTPSAPIGKLVMFLCFRLVKGYTCSTLVSK